ncbi:RNA polymerase sigma factor [Sphingobacterium siyangense]|uniref:RNA polymerase sigma factor n=1 Tax=Sphingobacterium siyangense TaxID=459529 RepID=UPI001963143F|nr:RNA polymerase sigma-70 factor [Sphingobacterium siyangense]QRY55568.1 RNA polymerase sigma-70 factor [Sphingobacterium siyangense]
MKKVSTLDEKGLLVKLQSGDHTAFENIYHLYQDRMIASALRLLKSPDLAEDLVQALFIKLWEQRMNIDTSKSLSAFLYKIASNMAYDIFRKASRDKQLFDHLLYNSQKSYTHIDDYIYSKENKEQLQMAIDSLPPQQRLIYTLCKIEEKSYQEVSRELNISEGTVNNHLTRANRAIKAYFSHLSTSGALISIFLVSIFGETS